MKTSPAGRKFLMDWEGVKDFAYRDSGGKLTIGVGHLLTDQERRTGTLRLGQEVIPWRPRLTLAQVDLLLTQDLRIAENSLNKVSFPWQQHQFDALISFIFNVGVGAFENSTLRRHLIAQRLENIPIQIKLWVNVNGKPVEGLRRRRTAESLLFTQGRYSHP